MNWYETNYLCKMCKGCEAVANGEANCLVDTEAIATEYDLLDEEEEF